MMGDHHNDIESPADVFPSENGVIHDIDSI